MNPVTAARAFLLVLVASLLFGGGYALRDWQQSEADLKVTKAQIKTVAREDTRRRVIGARHAQQQHDIEVFHDTLPDWWQLAFAERPELAGCELGPISLREWNRWNEGPDAAAADRRGAADQGPNIAATGGERPTAGSGGEPPLVHKALPEGGDAVQRIDR